MPTTDADPSTLERHLAEVLFDPIDEWDGDFPSMHSALAGGCADWRTR